MICIISGKEPQINSSCFIAPSADIFGDVKIGQESSVWFGTVIRGDGKDVFIGKGTNIQDNCTIHEEKYLYPTTIGDYVTVGHGAILHGCTIGNHCLIGMGSIILDGAEIGEYTIVGAGSLITKDKKIPSGVLCMGSPAKVIRNLTEEEKRSIDISAKHYVQISREYKNDLLNK